MNTDKKKKNRKINYEIKRVYVGKKPIGEIFEGVIEHIVDKNLEEENKNKQTQA